MDLAWTSLCALLILLPGFAFLAGLCGVHGVSRETRPKSLATELALVVVTSVVVHTLLLLLCELLGWLGLSFFDVSFKSALLVVMGPDDKGGLSPDQVAGKVAEHRVLLLLYLPLSLLCGYLVGVRPGRWLVSGPLRSILRHGWVYDMAPLPKKKERDATFAFASVLTRTATDDRNLCYSGPLTHFGLSEDGCFSYIILKAPSRFYVEKGAAAPRTTDPVVVGATSAAAGKRPIGDASIHIPGASIENLVIFERPAPKLSGMPSNEEDLRVLLLKIIDSLPPNPGPAVAPLAPVDPNGQGHVIPKAHH